MPLPMVSEQGGELHLFSFYFVENLTTEERPGEYKFETFFICLLFSKRLRLICEFCLNIIIILCYISYHQR